VTSLEHAPAAASDLRIGLPEREAARMALEEHLDEERLDAAEYEQRRAACEAARTESELMRIFADLPEPRPRLQPPSPHAPVDDDVSLLGWTVGVALGFGLPVGVVLGFTDGAWWSLAIPVGVSVFMLYVEHLRTAS
jgi:hypothetical protein